MGAAPKHVLMTYGLGDTYSPVETMRNFALVAHLHPASPVLDEYGLPIDAPPVKGNVQSGGVDITAVQAQYKPDMYDGHFVASRDAGARKSVAKFIGTFIKDGTPTF